MSSGTFIKELEDMCRIQVKFSEIDSMRRVWHGSYVIYFEDGRESFGRRYPGIGYADMQRAGIYAPIYDLHVRYYAPLEMNDVAIVHTRYIYKPGARLDFSYRILRESVDRDIQATRERLADSVEVTDRPCAEGDTVQLFISPDGALMTDLPDYYRRWQEQYLGTGRGL